MRIESVKKTAWLEIINAEDGEDLLVELNDVALSAKVRVYGYLSENLPEFFLFMKENWRGWSGSKKWGSLEGEFNLKAEMDKMGHITLKVYLCPSQYDGWEAKTNLYLEPNQLDRLYEEARELYPK